MLNSDNNKISKLEFSPKHYNNLTNFLISSMSAASIIYQLKGDNMYAASIIFSVSPNCIFF